MRPRTLAEVAALARAGDSFDFALREFLDEFGIRPDVDRLLEEPGWLKGVVEHGERWDAFLAATAEWLATELGRAPPAWVWEEQRTLHRPWFAVPWSGLRAILLQESPTAFRSRNLFVSGNALSRA
jgi:hypothetical protein